ncbi:MAG TPA: carboxypeptidase-like regulatory domain-containing protein, partial [Clostridia bacterium]|nr:carboxypeptidase-like regulatory domain-containing protein [Clostridia bacterium]
MRSLASTFLLTLFLANLGFSQDSRGAIAGRAMDPSGANLADIQVRVVNEQMGTAVEAQTNESGLYAVRYLLPGTYSVTAQRSGFKKLERKGIEVRVGETVTLDLNLALGEVTETIEVTASAPLLQRDSASLGAVIDRSNMMELPMAAGNAAELVDLAPGVGRTGSIAIHKAAFNAGTSTLVVNGNLSNANEFTIDGIPNTFASGTSPRIAFSPPSQTISEFKVQTSQYDASIGHTMGAVFNMNTKSGTNDLHGEVHHYLGNSALDATNFFANRNGKGKDAYTDNRYGGAIGGPVFFPKLYNGKNKTFFLYAFDGNKWGALQQYTNTVPTAAERQGDFSALLKLGGTYQIYNPFTTVAKGDGTFTRSPFPNNVIPASMIQPTAKAILAYYPDPNVPGNANGQNNFVRPTFAAKETYWAHFLRVDHTFNDKNRMFVRLDYDFWDEDENHWFGNDNVADGWNDGRTNRGMAIDHVYVLNPSTLINVRYGITQQDFPGTRPSKGFDLSSLGFSKNLTSLIPASEARFPNVVLTSFAELGTPLSPGDGINTSMIHSLAASATTLKGSHNLHYGVDFRVGRAFQNRYAQQVAPLLRFNTDYTKGPTSTSAASALGQDLAAMLLGIPAGSMQVTSSYASQDTWFGAYLQDDWKITPKFTATLGLRVEHESPLTER